MPRANNVVCERADEQVNGRREQEADLQAAAEDVGRSRFHLALGCA